MLVHEALAARQSVRKFLGKMPAHDDIVKILAFSFGNQYSTVASCGG